MSYQGMKVLVVGAGLSGVDACRFFLKQGAQVILTDSKSRDRLSRESPGIGTTRCYVAFRKFVAGDRGLGSGGGESWCTFGVAGVPDEPPSRSGSDW